MIRLFDSEATSFTSLGKGNLTDAISCTVTEEINGVFELEMTYPITGLHYSDIEIRDIIYAKANDDSGYQPFRIYSLSKPINGIVTVSAQHITYDLSGIINKGAYYDADNKITAVPYFNVGDAISAITSNILDTGNGSGLGNFTISYNGTFKTIPESNDDDAFHIKKPASVKALMGGSDGLNDVFGGEWKFDHFSSTLYRTRGEEKDIYFTYGKNITELTQKESISNIVTHIYPYYQSDSDGLVDMSMIVSEENWAAFNSNTKYAYGDCVYYNNKLYISEFSTLSKSVTTKVDSSTETSRTYNFTEFKGAVPGIDPPMSSVTYYAGTQTTTNDSSLDWETFWTEVKNWILVDGTYVYYERTDDDEPTDTILATYTPGDELVKIGTEEREYDSVYSLSVSKSGGSGAPATYASYLNAVTTYIGTGSDQKNLSTPDIDLTISFVSLEDLALDDPEATRIRSLQHVNLGDSVHVEYKALGVTEMLECIKAEYDVITERYNTITLGKQKATLSSTVSSAIESLTGKVTQTMMDLAIKHGTDLISGGLGGYVILNSSYAAPEGFPDEILILDANSGGNIALATSVIRMNQNGIAFSTNGYDGLYRTGWGIDGTFYADFIAGGHIAADYIVGGTLRLGGNFSYTNIGNTTYGDGKIMMYNSSSRLAGEWTASKFELYYNNTSATRTPLLLADSTGLKIYNSSGNTTMILDTSGNATFTGTVYATDGSFTGTVYATDGSFTGTVNATDGVFRGTVYADDGYFNGTLNSPIINSCTINSATISGTVLIQGETVYAHAMSIDYFQTSDQTFRLYENDALTIDRRVRIGSDMSQVCTIWNPSVRVGMASSSTTANLRVYDAESYTDGVTGETYFSGGLNHIFVSSSKRYKHDISDLSDNEIAAEKLYDLPVRQFIVNDGILYPDDCRANKLLPGFIAEEVEEIYPVAADYNDNDANVVETWSERYIIPPMLKLIQDQHKQILDLQARVSNLEGKGDQNGFIE